MLQSLLHLTRGNQTVTVRELAVLGILIDDPKVEPTIRGISAHMNVQKPVITRAADWLSSAGYAERRDDPNDKRIVRLLPTQAGKKFWRNFTKGTAKKAA